MIAVLLTLIFIFIAISIILPYGLYHKFIWEKQSWDIISDKCKEITKPELSPDNDILFEHCQKYPETYGVKP